MAFPGMGGMGMAGGQAADMDPQKLQEQQMVKFVRHLLIPLQTYQS